MPRRQTAERVPEGRRQTRGIATGHIYVAGRTYGERLRFFIDPTPQQHPVMATHAMVTHVASLASLFIGKLLRA